MSDPIVTILDALLAKAEPVEHLDGTKAPAVQIQLGLLGKTVAGAVSAFVLPEHSAPVPGVYKVLSVGQTPDGQKIMVETVVRGEAIQTLERMVDDQRSKILRSV
jgi:hypothetical protein